MEQSLKTQLIDFISKETDGTVDLHTLKQGIARNLDENAVDRLAEVRKLEKRLLTTINRYQTIFVKGPKIYELPNEFKDKSS